MEEALEDLLGSSAALIVHLIEPRDSMN